MVKDREVKIETEPFTKSKIKSDLRKVDFVYHLHYSKIKTIKKWLKKHKIELFLEEEIELTYFI